MFFDVKINHLKLMILAEEGFVFKINNYVLRSIVFMLRVLVSNIAIVGFSVR